jgi:hypothetical protein
MGLIALGSSPAHHGLDRFVSCERCMSKENFLLIYPYLRGMLCGTGRLGLDDAGLLGLDSNGLPGLALS